MNSTYYNTTGLKGVELLNARMETEKQDKKVLELFRTFPNTEFNYHTLHKKYNEVYSTKCEKSSIVRALNTLKNDLITGSMIVEVGKKKTRTGRPSMHYKFKSLKAVQECLF